MQFWCNLGERILAKKPRNKRIDPATGKKLPKGVTYRGPGQYRAQIWSEVQKKRFGKTFESAALARIWLEEQSVLRRSGRAGESLEQQEEQEEEDIFNGLTVRDLVIRYRDDVIGEIKKGGTTGHFKALITPQFGLGDILLKDLKYTHVRDWRNEMEVKPLDRRTKPAKAGTIVKRMNLLAKILGYAHREWDIPIENVATAKLVQRPAGADVHRGRILTPDEEHRLLEKSKQSEDNSNDYWFIRWSLASACRLSESLSLTWNDVDLDRRTFELEHTKNERYRKTAGPEERPMSPKAKMVLVELLDSLPEPPEATDKIFKVGGANACSQRIRKRAQKLNIMNWRVHDMRHDGTTRLAIKIRSVDVLKRYTGHEDIKMLMRYIQTPIEKLVEYTEEEE